MTRTDVTRLLERHVPADGIENGFKTAMLELLESCRGNVFSRDHFEPGHFTAGAYALSPDRKEVLFIWHNKKQAWVQPGGHIDAIDVSPRAAAMREFQEETGLEGWVERLLDVDIHPAPAKSTEPAHKHFDLRFMAIASGRDAVAGSDALKARWVAITDALTDPEFKRHARPLKKLLEIH